MRTYDIVLMLLSAGILIFLPWRLFVLKQLSEKDNRLFPAFWLWPLLLFAFENTVPIWATWTWLFQATKILILAGLGLDFFYYYGIKTRTARRAQWLSGLLLIPFLLFGFRGLLVRDPVLLVSPYYGKALVWTDSMFTPDTWYFMAPETRSGTRQANAYDDPNYGKAVFSPLTGTVNAVRETEIELRNEDLTVRLGPMLAGSVKLEAGDPVHQDQPLGLLDTGARPPGLRLEVTSERPVAFKDVFAGRWWAGRYDAAQLKRNQYVQSDSQTRFRVSPVTQ